MVGDHLFPLLPDPENRLMGSPVVGNGGNRKGRERNGDIIFHGLLDKSLGLGLVGVEVGRDSFAGKDEFTIKLSPLSSLIMCFLNKMIF